MREKLEAELREVEAQIDRAYWNFTRTKRGKPPVLVVPESYRRRIEIREQLRTLRNEEANMSRKITIEVTEKQLDDLIIVLGHAMDRGLGYGHVTRQEEALLEANRKRLRDKLQKLRTPKTPAPPPETPPSDIIKGHGNTAPHMEPGDFMKMGDKLVSWEFLMST